MQIVVDWFTNHLGNYISKELLVFLISICPVAELRGGLVAAALLKVPMGKAVGLCLLGNAIPVPIFFGIVRKLFSMAKSKTKKKGFAHWLRTRAEKKQHTAALEKSQFLGILAFVAVPLPGTGVYTGSLVAAILDMDYKKAVTAMYLGMIIAMVIVTLVFYVIPGAIS